ncbi:MAG TPA: creatininase family protein [Thermoprotei archaeon]|nr:creatininase family protein [Thermoprotei archaeon]
MRWEELTSSDFKMLDKDNLVAIIVVGSIEVHGPHLPLGTDTILTYAAVLKAAEVEDAVVLPPLYYCYVPENRNFEGTITISGDTFIKLLEEICDEVYRNGIKKILIVNGHGGNVRPLRLFLREMLRKGKRYQLYIVTDAWSPFSKEISEVKESKVIGHACEIETSLIMHVRPNLCKLNRVKGEAKLGVEKVVEGVEAMVDWISYAIEGYVGNPLLASKDKGEKLFNAWVRGLVEIIRNIKSDKQYPKILEQYYRNSNLK